MSGITASGPRKRTPPFPTRQMTILALCRICEPIAFMSIFPYAWFMVRDFGVAPSESQISIYAGMITSAFAFAEFSSGVPWGRLSDRVGRKPVLLTGLAGTALSMLIFGFAPNMTIALLARALGGLLNGNIGVLQTTVAEMVTVKEHQPRAYTIMPFVWCLGSILGPVLGGALARPVISYPEYFAVGSIWDKYPYLLPNLICSMVLFCGVIMGILFLEETHAEKKHRHDAGLACGKWILSKVTRCAESTCARHEKSADLDEITRLLNEDEQPPGYRTTQSSPTLASTPSPEPREILDLNEGHVQAPAIKPAVTKAFTKQVIMNIAVYGILAYHTMTFDAMFPTLLSSDKVEDTHDWNLPFKFVDGYHLGTKEIGIILSAQGLYSMVATLFIFPVLVRRLGALGLFRTIAISYPILYIATPYFVLLPESCKIAGVYILIIWKCTLATMSYPANAIMLTNSAPSLLMLGTINGVAASTASLCRAFGPTVSGALFSAGLRQGYSGLAWWCSAAIAMIGALISLRMTEKGGRMDVDEKADEDPEMGFKNHNVGPSALDSVVPATEERAEE